METSTELELPGNTCVYEHYDLKTLEPLNNETFIRLQEQGWKTQDFSGRTVLDIGCNSGLLTRARPSAGRQQGSRLRRSTTLCRLCHQHCSSKGAAGHGQSDGL
jgi:hypothetical protein